MDESGKYQYLQFNVKVLSMLNLWPDEGDIDSLKWRRVKTYFMFITSIPSSVPLIFEIYFTFSESDVDIVIQVQSILANACIWGMFYMGICFLQNRERIKALVDEIDNFKKYSKLNLEEIDRQATTYSKMFLIYSMVGMMIYTAMPFLSLEYCEQHKPQSMDKYGVPCGTIVRYRLPFRFDSFPMQEIFVAHQFYLGLSTTVIIVTITMLICGILLHVIKQLQELREHVLSISGVSGEEIVDAIRFAVNHHIAIIEYVKEINEAFGTQLILHITLTSFVISVLGFEILMVDNLTESLRFGMHLAGWFVLLFLICHYGQLLIDESIGVAHDVYYMPWYTHSVRVQKDIRMIIMRAQKPLTINAIDLGTISASTFLRVLSSSYSYFTLLINLKR